MTVHTNQPILTIFNRETNQLSGLYASICQHKGSSDKLLTWVAPHLCNRHDWNPNCGVSRPAKPTKMAQISFGSLKLDRRNSLFKLKSPENIKPSSSSQTSQALPMVDQTGHMWHPWSAMVSGWSDQSLQVDGWVTGREHLSPVENQWFCGLRIASGIWLGSKYVSLSQSSCWDCWSEIGKSKAETWTTLIHNSSKC